MIRFVLCLCLMFNTLKGEEAFLLQDGGVLWEESSPQLTAPTIYTENLQLLRDNNDSYSTFCNWMNDDSNRTALLNRLVVRYGENDNNVVAKRLLCIVVSYHKQHEAARAIAATWGRKCDKFIVMSDTSDPSIPAFRSSYPGEENGSTFWRKKVYIYEDVWRRFGNEFDYFLFTDDDTYIVIPNLRHLLATDRAVLATEAAEQGLYVGRRLRWEYLPTHPDNQRFFNAGGGYVLNQQALRVLSHALETNNCGNGVRNDTLGAPADVSTGKCLHSLGIEPIDTRDSSGRERFHPLNPYETWRYDGVWDNVFKLLSVNFQAGEECCARDSIMYHHLRSADYLMQTHAYIQYCKDLYIV